MFQKSVVLKNLEPIVSRAQWSRYRSNPEMSIPLSTIKLLVTDPQELFLISFTVTSIGNKKNQLPIKLPVKTKNNSLAKLLGLLTLSKNVFLTGTYQTDQREKIDALLETFDSIFDIQLCPEGEIAQNQRGYYIKIPVQICSALVKVFTSKYEANFPEIIRSVSNCDDEQDVLDFVNTWLRFSRIYRHGEDMFMFRKNDETEELVVLLRQLGVEIIDGSIIEGAGAFVPVYRIPKNSDNEIILTSPTILSGLKNKIQNQESRIIELETIKSNLERELNKTTQGVPEKLAWSRGIDEEIADHLAEKIEEFEYILIQMKREYEEMKQRLLLKADLTDDTSKIPEYQDSHVVKDLTQLREEVDILKDRLAQLSHSNSERELSYKVTQEFTMKQGQLTGAESVNVQIVTNLVKTFLAHPDNWILFILGAENSLSKEQLRKILNISFENVSNLTKKLNDFVDNRILKVIISSTGEELYQLDTTEWRDRNRSYKDALLGNKDFVPLEIRQLVRQVLR
ncbi:MAG: hypothetical protein EAX86_00335 [Candidatus Heimdallarchaeota archaeon]|nr:hypothetical protein [Candidatus Heimdallarchaeota archaeon]